MNKTTFSSLLLFSSSLLFADTTMCFKENHTSMSTIENTKLDGGECKGSFSVTDMKAKGWSVDDIKITTTSNGMNFIYIFKNGSTIPTTTIAPTSESQEQMEARILAKLEAKKEEEKKAKEIEEKINLAQEGEALYIAKCQGCHGAKGETLASGTSRALNTLSNEDMQIAIRDYSQGNYDRGMAVIMQPITSGISKTDIDKVHSYLQKINK